MSDRPGVAIVTPSLNQARFLRDAIESVLAQEYAPIDYLVVDGGSKDDSLEILRSYGDRVRWISEPDRGQADAIVKGFARTQGGILSWLNSDDTLAAGAVARAVDAFEHHPHAGLIYGDGVFLDESGRTTGPFPWTEPFDLWRLIHFSDYILQPAAFFRRSAYDAAGGLDVDLHWAMDWDLWIRLAGVADVVYLPETLGGSRLWGGMKTRTGGWRRIAELARLARRHAGRALTPAVKRYALDTLAQQTRRWLPAAPYRLIEPWGRRIDRSILRTMTTHGDGWLAPRSELVFPRRWGAARLELEVPRLARRRPLGLEIRVDGQPVRTLRPAQPGIVDVELSPAFSSSPFCRVALRADGSLRRSDGRRVAARLVRLEPAAPVRPLVVAERA